MLKFLSLYGINALSFLLNVGAIFFYSGFAGAAGYGTYGVYVTLMSVFVVFEFSLLKAALTIAERQRSRYDEAFADASAVSFIRFTFIPSTIASLCLVLAAGIAFPSETSAHIDGKSIAIVVTIEHMVAYQYYILLFRLTREGKYATVYGLRLFSTVSRHAIAWSVLLVSGSIEMAIYAIALKGIVIGLLSHIVLRHGYPKLNRFVHFTGKLDGICLLGAFMSSAFLLLAIQEIPAIEISRTFGRETLGVYRVFYDLVAAVWFVASIYPTVLFSYLLPKKGVFDPIVAAYRVKQLSKILLSFHICYSSSITFVLLILQFYGINLVAQQMEFALPLTAAVSILGYSRFLIEALQAFGRSRDINLYLLLTIASIVFLIYIGRDSNNLEYIGWVWLFTQSVLLCALRFAVAKCTNDYRSAFSDILMLSVGFLVLVNIYKYASEIATLAISAFIILSSAAHFIASIRLVYLESKKPVDQFGGG